MKQNQRHLKYLNVSIILLAIFYLLIPFMVVFPITGPIIYGWYMIPFIALYYSVLLHKHDRKMAMHPIIFSLIGILTALMFAFMFSAIVK